MSEQRFSLPETAVLLVLMAEAREISNPELKERYGLTLDGKERRRLNELKLVDSRKQGRAFAHMLTDAGWAWCVSELGAVSPPPRAGSAGGALYAILAGLGRHLDRANLSLADVFAPADPLPPSASAALPASSPAPPATPPDVDVEARVRTAYQELAAQPGGWVKLAPVRQRLGDLPRAEVDAVLVEMSRQQGVAIVPESNQKTLSAEDRGSAVRIGGQDKHLLSIGI
jgi:hypothetical protein